MDERRFASVQVIPPGLLGAFQIKNGGRNPVSLGQDYVPTLDMREWALIANVRTLGATNIGAVTNGYADFQDGGATSRVPEKEWWYVHDFSAHLKPLVTTDDVTLSPAYQVDTASGGDTIIVGDPFRLVVTAAAADLRVFSARTPFLVPPNSLFGGWVHNALLVGPVDLAVRVRYTPLPI